nr:IncF plasmid conjugative transfer protein TraN [Proteus terrae subsp. cibarius]
MGRLYVWFGAQSALFSNVGGAVGADGVVSGGNFALGALRARF